MRRFYLAIVAMMPCAVLAAPAPPAAQQGLQTQQKREYNMVGYLGNTLVTYIPRSYENHTWYNADGTAVHFNGSWAEDKGVAMKVYEEKWKADAKGDFPRVVPIDANGKEGVALQLRNHYPGDHWRELIPTGPNHGMREQYAIVPDHQ